MVLSWTLVPLLLEAPGLHMPLEFRVYGGTSWGIILLCSVLSTICALYGIVVLGKCLKESFLFTFPSIFCAGKGNNVWTEFSKSENLVLRLQESLLVLIRFHYESYILCQSWIESISEEYFIDDSRNHVQTLFWESRWRFHLAQISFWLWATKYPKLSRLKPIVISFHLLQIPWVKNWGKLSKVVLVPGFPRGCI